MVKFFLPLFLLAYAYAQKPVAMPDANLQPQDDGWMLNPQPLTYNALDMLGKQEVILYYSLDTSFYKDVAVFGLDPNILKQTLPNMVRPGGEPTSTCVDMYSLLALNIKATQELQQKVHGLNMQLTSIDDRMKALRSEMEQLKELVGQSSQDSRVLETTLDKVGQLELKMRELEQKIAAMPKD